VRRIVSLCFVKPRSDEGSIYRSRFHSAKLRAETGEPGQFSDQSRCDGPRMPGMPGEGGAMQVNAISRRVTRDAHARILALASREATAQSRGIASLGSCLHFDKSGRTGSRSGVHKPRRMLALGARFAVCRNFNDLRPPSSPPSRASPVRSLGHERGGASARARGEFI